MKPHQHDLVILFDHDGTVVDSETIALESAWRLTSEVAGELALNTMSLRTLLKVSQENLTGKYSRRYIQTH